MSYPQTYPQTHEGNKGTERKKTEFRSLGKTAEKGNGTEHTPLGVFPVPFRRGANSCRKQVEMQEKVIHRNVRKH